MSKNQIWVGIVLVGVVILFLVSDIEIKVKIGDEYSFEAECAVKESQLCPDSDTGTCQWDARNYCKRLGLPENP